MTKIFEHLFCHPHIAKANNEVQLFSSFAIEFNSPKEGAYRLALQIIEKDSRIDPGDALRVAEAMEANAVFITIDEKLLSSKELAKFGAKIVNIAES